jgi:hypothetical protein
MKQRTLSVLTTGELELTPPTEAGGARSVLRWSGSGELLLFNRNSANDLAGQSHVWDWWVLRDDQHPSNLTGAMKSVPPSLIAVKGTGGFVGATSQDHGSESLGAQLSL